MRVGEGGGGGGGAGGEAAAAAAAALRAPFSPRSRSNQRRGVRLRCCWMWTGRSCWLRARWPAARGAELAGAATIAPAAFAPRRYALTGKEVKSILMQRLVKVDGKVRAAWMHPRAPEREPRLSNLSGRWPPLACECAGAAVPLCVRPAEAAAAVAVPAARLRRQCWQRNGAAF
jgi:hypothetical protein